MSARPQILLIPAAGCAGLAIVSCLAWRVVGWIGVGIVGALVAFIAVRIDIEADAPVAGHQHHLYASLLDPVEPSMRAETAATRRTSRLFQVFGALLAAIGFGGFVLWQLPR